MTPALLQINPRYGCLVNRLALVIGLSCGCGDNLQVGVDGGDVDGPALDVPPSCVGPDEDGDAWPDACDNCPTEPNADQRDVREIGAGQDADGVGDACDPRPTQTGDFLGLVEMHNAAGAYTMLGTTSLMGNGTLRLGSLGAAGSATFVSPPRVTRIDSAYTIVDASDDLQWVGVWTDDSGAEALFHEAAWDPSLATSVFHLKELHAPSPDRLSTDLPGPTRLATGDRFRVIGDTELTTGGDHRLTVMDRDRGTTQMTTLAIQIPRVTSGYLESFRLIADFDYLVIYAIR